SVFVLDGHSESQFDNISAPLLFNKGHHNIQYNHQFTGRHIISSPAFRALTITYDLTFLKGLLQSDDTRCIAQLANCVYGGKTFLANKQALQSHGPLSD